MSVLRKPLASKIDSILSMSKGKYRSDSAMARPHVGKATQALADSSDQSGTLPADVVALLCADKSP